MHGKLPLPEDVRRFARKLRSEQTNAEQFLWGLLRGRRLLGLKFRRQHPHEPYTMDFYCAELRLAIELDGSQHGKTDSDAVRDQRLAEAGIMVIRYWNHDVLLRTESVLEDIYLRLQARAIPLGAKLSSVDATPKAPPSSGAARHLPPEGEGKK